VSSSESPEVGAREGSGSADALRLSLGGEGAIPFARRTSVGAGIRSAVGGTGIYLPMGRYLKENLTRFGPVRLVSTVE
jgi:hypothetical protein